MYISGTNISLRNVSLEDAEYLYQLRQDPTLNIHLSPPPKDLENQRNWLINYAERQKMGLEFYFLILRITDGMRCGCVRLYDIDRGSFTWGSWILDGNKPNKAALESAILVYDFAFDTLILDIAKFDVRNKNANVLKFHKRFGAKIIAVDDENTYFSFSKEEYNLVRTAHVAHL